MLDVEFTEEQKNKFWDLEQQIKDTAATLQNTYKDIFGLAFYSNLQNFTEPDALGLDWAKQGGKPVNKHRYPQENYQESVDALVNAVKQKGIIGNQGLISSDEYSHKTVKDISKERSFAMHKAATRSCYNEKAVWKIGNQHVKHINDEYSDNINYNLVTQEKFNDHFNKYLESKNKAKSKKRKRGLEDSEASETEKPAKKKKI